MSKVIGWNKISERMRFNQYDRKVVGLLEIYIWGVSYDDRKANIYIKEVCDPELEEWFFEGRVSEDVIAQIALPLMQCHPDSWAQARIEDMSYWEDAEDNYADVLVESWIPIYEGEELEPEPEPEPTEIDYDKVVEGTQTVVNAAIVHVEKEIDDNQTLIEDLQGSLDDVSEGVITQITNFGEGVIEGFNSISDKIDGLTFPTLDNIKGAFLDACADLATSLWDAILNKIEERYPKDEEESD